MNAPVGSTTQAAGLRRPKPLLVYLVLATLGAAVGMFKGLTMREEMIAQYPRLAPPVFWIYFATLPLQLLAIAGLWQLRRWAVHLSLALAVAVIAIDLRVGIPWQHAATVAAMAAFLLAAAGLSWKRLR